MREKLQTIGRNLLWQRRISPQGLNHMRESLLDESCLNRDYLVLTIGSCAIATFGLLSNSVAVIIGAMIIAPLMLPIRGFAFGALEGDLDLIRQGVKALIIGSCISVGMAGFIGLLVGISGYGSEVLARSKPNLLDLGVAVAAGGISGFAKVEPKVSSTLAGTAIAVALMPPLCVIGLGLAQGAAGFTLARGATLLYLTNLLGITLSCMVVFLTAGYAPLARARGAIGITLACIGMIGIPLGTSFIQLVRQDRLEATLRDLLLNQTVTFQQVQLVRTQTNWLAEPPEVHLLVVANEPITPKQVGLLEAFIAQKMGRPFTLIFQVSQFQEVTRNRVSDNLDQSAPDLADPQL